MKVAAAVPLEHVFGVGSGAPLATVAAIFTGSATNDLLENPPGPQAGGRIAVGTKAAPDQSLDTAVLVLAEAICDAQLILTECFEQDLPDAARTLDKLHAILEDQAVIEALKTVGYVRE